MNAAVAPAAVVVRRTIAASAEDLFDAWLDPEALAVWMRPGGIKKTTAKVDARVGGRYEIVMQGDETYPHTGEYRLIDRPRQLVFTWISNGTEQHESLVTVDFLRAGKHTEVVVTHEQLPQAQRTSHTNGWASALEHLDEHYSA
jgi:uncharacterized protein YndB with AHSA1/START domain